MKMTKKWRALAALLVCGVLMLTGCASQQETAVTPVPATQAPAAEPVSAATADVPAVAEPTAAPAAQQNDAVLATVNGKPVTRAAVDDVAGTLIATYAAWGLDTTGEDAVREIRALALDTAIQMEILDQKAVEWGTDALTDAEIADLTAQATEEWENIVVYYMQAAGVTEASTDAERAEAREKAIALLAEQGYTQETILNAALRSARVERLQAEMVKDVMVTDEDVTTAYEAHVAADQETYGANVEAYEVDTKYLGATSYYVPAGYRGVQVIVLPVDGELMENYYTLSAGIEEQVEQTSENGGTAADGAAPSQEQLDTARGEILASVQPAAAEIDAKLAAGTPFAQVAAEYSTESVLDTLRTPEGDLMIHMDSVMYDPALVEAAFSVKEIGQTSQPAVGISGVYIVCYVRDVPAGAVPLEQVRSEITEQVLETRESQVIEDTLASWVEEAEIVVTPEGEAYVGR